MLTYINNIKKLIFIGAFTSLVHSIQFIVYIAQNHSKSYLDALFTKSSSRLYSLSFKNQLTLNTKNLQS